MHESGLMRGLIRQLEALAETHACDSLAGVKLSIRESGGYSPEHFAEHFRAAALGTRAESAAVDIEVVTDEYHPGPPQITIVSIEVPA